MYADQKHRKLMYADVKEAVGNIENITLSFHILLDKLISAIKTEKSQKYLLVVLKGPFLKSTRRKLRNLDRNFKSLKSNLDTLFDIYFREYQNVAWKGEDVSIRRNVRKWADYQQKNARAMDVLTTKLVAKLSVPKGAFYEEIQRGSLSKVGKDATSLKEDVDALLSMVRNLKR